jgi:Fe-S oxidoreductase/nitrate reductase gamma subunit
MQSIPVINYVVLAVLLVGALACLVFGLRTHWHKIRQGKAFFGSPLTRKSVLGKVNLRAFVSLGLLTSRLKKKPVAGAAHGLLFFGSLVLIVGHGVLPLSWVGVSVYDGWFGYWFMELGREIAGIALFLGALFFLLRRVVPPERLSAYKARSGFKRMEVFLLALVVTGFAAESLRLGFEPEPSGGEFMGGALGALLAGTLGTDTAYTGFHLLWWLHGLMGVAFIGLIPFTALSHMLLGPANSALTSSRPGMNLPPIDFDLDDAEEPAFGAARLADLSQKNLLDASACLWCGRCHEVCPATQTGKDLSPKKVMAICAEYLEEGKLDDASLIDVLGRDAMFNCTTCAACVEVCPVSNNPAETILEFRRHFVMDRSDMPDTMAAANRNLESREHPFVGTGASPEDWRAGLDVPFFEAGKTEYLLWIGCSVTYEERAQEIARAMVRILDAAGVSYGILEEARCTGDPAKVMGNEMQFVEMAEANIEDFQSMRVQKVITMCAHCFNSFDRYYPELGADWQTIPHSVLLDQLMRDGRLTVERKTDQTITFHDPCYLARHNDIVDEARSVLSSIGQLIEMPRNKKESFCCGAGGGNYWGEQAGTERVADVRMCEALETGADKVATSCPFCLLMLTSSASKHGPDRKVFDIAELVAESLPEGEDA